MYIDELSQFFWISSCVFCSYFRASRLVFASIALRLLSPFDRLGFVLGTGDDGTRETFSEDGVVFIGCH